MLLPFPFVLAQGVFDVSQLAAVDSIGPAGGGDANDALLPDVRIWLEAASGAWKVLTMNRVFILGAGFSKGCQRCDASALGTD